MLGWDINRAGIEFYMSLEGKAALIVEEFIMNAQVTSNVTEMWNALDRAFLPMDKTLLVVQDKQSRGDTQDTYES